MEALPIDDLLVKLVSLTTANMLLCGVELPCRTVLSANGLPILTAEVDHISAAIDAVNAFPEDGGLSVYRISGKRTMEIFCEIGAFTTVHATCNSWRERLLMRVAGVPLLRESVATLELINNALTAAHVIAPVVVERLDHDGKPGDDEAGGAYL